MYHNRWPVALEVEAGAASDDNILSRNSTSTSEVEIISEGPPSRRRLEELDETQRSWLLDTRRTRKPTQVDLGCITCDIRFFLFSVCVFWTACLGAGIGIVVWKYGPKQHPQPPPVDNYTVALGMALNFFDFQKSGYLPPANNVTWRGPSALLDGQNTLDNVKTNLTGGYYDAGDNIKFGFPGAFTMTLLSWGAIEYGSRYEAIGEMEHIMEIIKWGTDYILETFNASNVDKIYVQVGVGNTPGQNDLTCWERPEDLDYFDDTSRIALPVYVGSDLAGEMAAALAAASIVFKDTPDYSKELLKGATALYKFAVDVQGTYSANGGLLQSEVEFYNSSGYYDELLWGGAWLYYATGNSSYLSQVTYQATNNTNPGAAQYFGVFDWDNKLVGAQLLLTRLRILQGPGYPYEQMLSQYNNQTNLVMCAYLPYFTTFPRTPAGLILFDERRPQPLPAVANAAFLAALYADYLEAADMPIWQCGPNQFGINILRNFSQSQIDYILGINPLNMSYVAGFSDKFPQQVHHRAASMPFDNQRYSCTGGYIWRDKNASNPHVLPGAMVGGPDNYDQFTDIRSNSAQTEPSLVGNAGLVAALIAHSNATKGGIDIKPLFAAIPPSYPSSPPPPAPWNP
ncbi:hypothetical protein CY35_12G029600 [Sphagnum magellanicum]|nr:hypothetical protein CY35_12G029600 [Sphagnum magellanicum]KAH9545069.1 hypothetical protein CY35_12G029600 [Sphagnum magellanicum]